MNAINPENPKRPTILAEYNKLLTIVELISNSLEGQNEDINANSLLTQIGEHTSFGRLADWAITTINRDVPGVPDRINELVNRLDKEFSWVDEVSRSQITASLIVQRMCAFEIAMHFLDTSIILHVLGLNGPALIELHSVLERDALDRSIEIIFKQDKIDLGEKVMGRKTLSDLASILFECNIIGKEDLKFAQELNKLRNGLGHKNINLISNAILSGKELCQGDIDWVMSNVDYTQYLIGAVRILTKLMVSNDALLRTLFIPPKAG